jgi:catechol 2,3-dioxygenase-like lactoylglutathione lyase family enzyme
VCPGAVNLNHVTLCISDLDRSVAFYRRLGLIQIVADDDYARFVCPDGDSTLSLHCHPGAGPVEDAVSVISLHFETDRLDEVVAELEEQGIRFEQAPDAPHERRRQHDRADHGNGDPDHLEREATGDPAPAGRDGKELATVRCRAQDAHRSGKLTAVRCAHTRYRSVSAAS